MKIINKPFDDTRQIALAITILLAVALFVLGSRDAFALDVVSFPYIFFFSLALRFALPKRATVRRRFADPLPWIALASACLTACGAILFMEPEGGLGLSFLAVGFYLGLPILLLTMLLTSISFPIDKHA
ncbi:hypothetical protein [Sphingomonas sp. PB4P5]|uniref:hypothetical protein n=1 Tax=Parasphingomonas puruogangriensis TaxID=3096155 RepID=UPI002FCA3AEA